MYPRAAARPRSDVAARHREVAGALVSLITLSLLAGCAAGEGPRDGGPDAGTPEMDAAPPRLDAGRVDAYVPDPDAGPGEGAICEPCEEHGDCSLNHYCVSLTVGGRACLPSCVADLPDCPRGFNCLVDVAAGVSDPLCVPTGGPCCVDEDADEHGMGAGCVDRDCDDDDPDVHPGAMEVCDGVDDDCDGTVDDPPTDCAVASCAAVGDGTFEATDAALCESGACTTPTSTSCGAFACEPGGDGCATACLDGTGAADHTRCAATAYCTAAGECVPRVTDGSACGSDVECASGHCDNGTCCSGGTCCVDVSDCPPATVPICDETSTCQGARGDATCEDFRCRVESGIADDRGCTDTTLATSCGFYDPIYCTGETDQTTPSCPTGCTDDDECVDGAHCNAGLCAPDRPPGDTCSRDGQCSSGLTCVSGVCCTASTCDDGNACTQDLCTGGTCSQSAYCAGTATSCGCGSCTNCSAQDGWVNAGTAYSCCEAGERCACQDQEYLTYTCGGTSCVASVTDTRVVRTGCSACTDSNACTVDACVDGACTFDASCAGTTTSCGCSSCTDCSAQDGWYDVGAPYACCEGGAACSTCQDQEQRTFSCAGTSCTYIVTGTQVARSGCATCDDGNTCTADSCVAGVCGAAAYCAGTTASCGCTSCTACTGGMTCQAGSCACPSGQTDCSGTCRSLQTDEANCSACGRACPAGAMCSAGACRYGTQSCPTGQYAIGFSSAGTIQCSTLNAIAMAAVHARCRLYYGWRDNCGGTCSTAPSGWGYTTHDSCVVGAGTTNRCGIHTGDEVRMFTLNTFNSDVDENDRFYYGLHCTTGESGTTTTTGMCPAGSYITSLNADGSFVCRSAEEAVTAYVRDDCRIYAGWNDNCNGCTTTASRSGYAGHGTCATTGGDNGTCASYSLGGTTVRMFGLNTNGDVDGNDQFRIGFSCPAIADAPASASACSASQLATGVSGGSVTCNAAEARADDYVRASCSVYQGWVDGCGGTCTAAPSKWGRASSVSCQSALGDDNSCASYALGGRSVPMFGLNTDGDVDENDRFYLGLRCF